MTVTVLPVNEPPVISGDDKPSIKEGSSFVDAYTVMDQDDTTIVWLSLSGADSGLFEFDRARGELRFTDAPDFEDSGHGKVYRVTLRVSAGLHTTPFDVEVTVTNVEETGDLAFPSPQPQARSDYTATLSDPDNVVSTTWTWERSASPGGPWTPVSGTPNDLLLRSTYQPVDAEVGDFLRVTVDYTDAQDVSMTRNLDEVSDNAVIAFIPDNNPPTFEESNPTREVAENAGADATVGAEVTATDTDVGDVVTYTLTGSTVFRIDSTSGQILVVADNSLDHETAPTHTVTVTATDTSNASVDTAVTISVTDVNEAPVAGNYDETTPEDMPVTFDVLEPDTDPEDDALSVRVTTDPQNGSATVDTTTFDITYTPQADYFGSDSFDYEIRDESRIDRYRKDHGTGRSGVNDGPQFPGDPLTREVARSAQSGDHVGTPVTATDVDDDPLTYRLLGSEASSFEIDQGTGQITVGGAVTDIAARDSYTVTVEANDGSNEPNDTATTDVTINVVDQPVGPPIFSGGGGGGGGGGGPSPSVIDFEWTVTRDIDQLDGGHDKPSGQWSDGTTLWLAHNGDGADDAVYAYDLESGRTRGGSASSSSTTTNRAPRGRLV